MGHDSHAKAQFKGVLHDGSDQFHGRRAHFADRCDRLHVQRRLRRETRQIAEQFFVIAGLALTCDDQFGAGVAAGDQLEAGAARAAPFDGSARRGFELRARSASQAASR